MLIEKGKLKKEKVNRKITLSARRAENKALRVAKNFIQAGSSIIPIANLKSKSEKVS